MYCILSTLISNQNHLYLANCFGPRRMRASVALLTKQDLSDFMAECRSQSSQSRLYDLVEVVLHSWPCFRAHIYLLVLLLTFVANIIVSGTYEVVTFFYRSVIASGC